MSAKGKVKIVVFHPANPLAPPPRATPGTPPSVIDGLLLKLPISEKNAAKPARQPPSVGEASKSRRREPQAKRAALNVHEKVRNLTVAEQQKIARTGELPMRVALERVYGKAVWESLLRNSRLTPPEVLRISRMASLPVPLLELIVNNRAWLGNPQVRRALLRNRRLTKDLVATVLRATPKNELKIMHKQTAYPPVVREAAAKMLK